MAELRHGSEVESTPKTENTSPSEKKVSSEVQQANQSELKPQKAEKTENKEESTDKKSDTPSSEVPLEKKETSTEIPKEAETPKNETKDERPSESVPLQTKETHSPDAESSGKKLTPEETEALKDKIRGDIAQMKESPSGYKDFENGARDVPTDQPAKLSSKNFDKLYEQRGYTPEQIQEQKASFKGYPEQDKSLNNAARHPEKTDDDIVTARHITKEEPVNVYGNEKGASGRYSTKDVYTEPSEVQKNLATPDYNTGEYKNESTLNPTLKDGRQNTVIEGTVAPQKADGKVFTEDRPGGGKQILTDGGYEGGGITKGETRRLESSPSGEITSVKGIDNEKPLGKIAENSDDTESKPLTESEDNRKRPEAQEVSKQPLTEKEENAVKAITYPHFERAREITQEATKTNPDGLVVKDDKGSNFTDHNEKHVEQVKDKTTEALDASAEAAKAGKLESENANGDIHFNDNVDRKVTQAAALAHDTGMSNDGYSLSKNENGKYVVEKQNPRDFDSVRSNHSANSALNVLKNRDKYKDAGFSDKQVDEMAMLTYSHSKSNSGVRNLNDSKCWKDGFDRMDALVGKYNEDHPDKPISFNRERFEGDADSMGSLATESLALRVGDVSRDSGPDAPSQSGERVHVDKNTVDSKATNFNDEIKNAVVTRGDELITNEKAKQVHVGEQNITGNTTEFNDGKLNHNITVADGNYAPNCTAEAIKDHLGEFASAQNGDFAVNVNFDSPCSPEMQTKYDEWRDRVTVEKDEKTGEQAFPNVSISFPWDERSAK